MLASLRFAVVVHQGSIGVMTVSWMSLLLLALLVVVGVGSVVVHQGSIGVMIVSMLLLLLFKVEVCVVKTPGVTSTISGKNLEMLVEVECSAKFVSGPTVGASCAEDESGRTPSTRSPRIPASALGCRTGLASAKMGSDAVAVIVTDEAAASSVAMLSRTANVQRGQVTVRVGITAARWEA